MKKILIPLMMVVLAGAGHAGDFSSFSLDKSQIISKDEIEVKLRSLGFVNADKVRGNLINSDLIFDSIKIHLASVSNWVGNPEMRTRMRELIQDVDQSRLSGPLQFFIKKYDREDELKAGVDGELSFKTGLATKGGILVGELIIFSKEVPNTMPDRMIIPLFQMPIGPK